MSHAWAFFAGVGAGVVVTAALVAKTFWRLRNGPADKPSPSAATVVLAAVPIGLMVGIAVTMPDLRTELLGLLGIPIGMTVARFLGIPFMYLGSKRLERRWEERGFALPGRPLR